METAYSSELLSTDWANPSFLIFDIRALLRSNNEIQFIAVLCFFVSFERFMANDPLFSAPAPAPSSHHADVLISGQCGQFSNRLQMNGYTRRDIVTWHLSAHLGGILCTSFHLLISLATFTAALNGRQIQTDLVCDSVSRIISKTQQHCSLLRSYYFGRNIHFCHKSNVLCSAPDCSSNVIIKRHRLSGAFWRYNLMLGYGPQWQFWWDEI